MTSTSSEALTKAPAFQMYTGDFLSSPDVALMAAHEVGAYCLLLFTAWQSDKQGYLENDEDRLRRIARLSPKQWKESRNLLLKKFVETEDKSLRFNPRLAAEAERLAQYRKQMRENGEKGGRPKQNNPMVSPANQKVISKKPESNQNENTSSSTSLKTKTSAFVLPEWVDQEAWDGFEEMRNKLRKPMTDRARGMLVNELEKLRSAGNEVAACLKRSTMKGWTDVYPQNGSASFNSSASSTSEKPKYVDPAAAYSGKEYSPEAA
jgi:uncharacterized protein YdaU (DUF1376 family)